jgi:hypothetical protein
MQELYKQVAAKFLNDSRFIVQVQTPPEMLHPEVNLPKEYIKERLHAEMIQRVGQELAKVFEKEIKTEDTGGFGERHTLEFFAFPKEAFKLMVEFIVAEMPEQEINRIRSNS